MKRLGVIIVAGGGGTRMGAEIPKQFLELCGKPILMRCIENFASAEEIVVVLPKDQIDFWSELCNKHNFKYPHKVATGGDTRFQSVKNALSVLSECQFIAVQDGVRPFTSQRIIAETLSAAESFGAAIPVVEVTDSLREITTDGSRIVPRNRFRAVQTPQIFRSEILLEAYKVVFDEKFTDDASVVEASGHKIALTKGDPKNIKITTPIDLSVAQQIFDLKSVSLPFNKL